MSKTPKAKVAFAVIGFDESGISPSDWGTALIDSLVPGTLVERYSRRWRMGRHELEADRWLRGRMGFESLSEETGIWDEVRMDFRTITPAHIVPFVVDMATHRVAFELRAGSVKPGTFQGNFQALLAKASGWPWAVRLEGITQPPWEEWRERTSAIKKLVIIVRVPNPHFDPQDDLIERTFDEAKLRALKIGASGENIDPDGPELFRQALNEVDRGHGEVRATGIVAGKEDDWSSAKEAGVRKERAVREPETRQVSFEELQRLLEKRAREEEGE